MRRTIVLLATMVLTLLVASGMASAATIDCVAEIPCTGTQNADTMNGSAEQDSMNGRAGKDLMKGNGSADEMHGGLGADELSGGAANDLVWGGTEKGSELSTASYPDKSDDSASGGIGADLVYGGFGQGGVDHVFGNDGDDTIVVAQRGFTDGDVRVTKEIVDCGKGEDTVYRDKGKDVIARNCEHKKEGFPLA